jgi:hypothetical protein
MATAQTMQQRNSLDLALANPVYQGEWTTQLCAFRSHSERTLVFGLLAFCCNMPFTILWASYEGLSLQKEGKPAHSWLLPWQF